MPRGARWSEDEIARMRDLREQGLSWDRVAEELGRGRDTTRAKASQVGLIERRHRPPPAVRRKRLYASCVLS